LVTMFPNYVFRRIAYHIGSLTGGSYCYRLPTEQAGLGPTLQFLHAAKLGRIETRDLSTALARNRRPAQKFHALTAVQTKATAPPAWDGGAAQ
jgi:hypothetical protein